MTAPEVLPPLATSWVDLGSALNWLVEGMSRPLPPLLEGGAEGPNSDELLARWQPAWERVADAGSGGRLRLRGRPMIGAKMADEIALTVDDFRSCTILDLMPRPGRPGETLLCARINKRGFDGYFDDFNSHARHGFALIVAARDDLMALHPIEAAMRQLRTMSSMEASFDRVEAEQKAAEWLHHQLSTRPVGSKMRDWFRGCMVREFGVSSRAATHIWKSTTAVFPEWSKSGRPPSIAKLRDR